MTTFFEIREVFPTTPETVKVLDRYKSTDEAVARSKHADYLVADPYKRVVLIKIIHEESVLIWHSQP